MEHIKVFLILQQGVLCLGSFTYVTVSVKDDDIK